MFFLLICLINLVAVPVVLEVIPFFLAHPLQGAKKKEFADFVKVAELMKLKAHLTKDGLEQIRSIKLGMNFKRP